MLKIQLASSRRDDAGIQVLELYWTPNPSRRPKSESPAADPPVLRAGRQRAGLPDSYALLCMCVPAPGNLGLGHALTGTCLRPFRVDARATERPDPETWIPRPGHHDSEMASLQVAAPGRRVFLCVCVCVCVCVLGLPASGACAPHTSIPPTPPAGSGWDAKQAARPCVYPTSTKQSPGTRTRV